MAAYSKGISVSHVVLALATLLRRGSEWALSSPVFVLNGDVLQAFDHLSPQSLAQSLHDAKNPAAIISAILEEMKSLQCRPEFEDLPAESTELTSCIRQGGNEAVFGWTAVLRMLLSCLAPGWERSELGLRVNDGFMITHVTWSDNIWLISSSRIGITTMFRQLTAAMAAHGLEWKTEKNAKNTSLCSLVSSDGKDARENLPAQKRTIEINTDLGEFEVEHTDTMEILGTHMKPNGDTISMVEHRFRKANAKVWKYSEALHCRDVPISERLKLYSQRVASTAIHGSGAWIWTQGLVRKIHSWEGLTLRTIFGFRRRGDETWVQYHRRTLLLTRKAFIDAGYIPLTMKVLMSICTMAISLSSNSGNPVMKFLHTACAWKDGMWWQAVHYHGMLEDPNNKRKWKHQRRGRLRPDWDKCLVVQALGQHWREHVASKRESN